MSKICYAFWTGYDFQALSKGSDRWHRLPRLTDDIKMLHPRWKVHHVIWTRFSGLGKPRSNHPSICIGRNATIIWGNVNLLWTIRNTRFRSYNEIYFVKIWIDISTCCLDWFPLLLPYKYWSQPTLLNFSVKRKILCKIISVWTKGKKYRTAY